VKEVSQPRSLASAEASRRNGALSKGPRTALGKIRSSQNSRKHGLFSTAVMAGALPPSPLDLGDIAGDAAGGWLAFLDQAQVAGVARVQLGQATQIIDDMRAVLDQLLAEDELDTEAVARLMREITRLARYQRRFRGKRDRALRQLMVRCAPAAEGFTPMV
jgi:hypothetical protein